MFFTRCIMLIALFIWGATESAAVASNLQTLRLSFYDQEIELDYQEGLRYPYQIRVEELALRRLYAEMERRPHADFLRSLQLQAELLVLNDWLYAELLRQALSVLYQAQTNSAAVVYATYFFLSKSGYDVRLTYREQQLHVNVYTEDVIYEMPMITEGGRKYANISISGPASRQRRSMYLLDHKPNPNGRAFSFELNRWPLLMNESRERSISFQFSGRTYELQLRYQSGLAGLLKTYPLVDEYWYLNAPISQGLQQTLVPQLRRLMRGRSLRERLELLAAFTRSAFVYKDDKQAFGGNKPMVPDELFFYPYSDCEDRSALFYALAKVLLELPMIVIAYDDHLTLAVAAPGLSGDTVKYRGRSFLFCDPTGPQNSSEIGRIPQGYQNRSFEVIGYYPGNNDQ